MGPIFWSGRSSYVFELCSFFDQIIIYISARLGTDFDKAKVGPTVGTKIANEKPVPTVGTKIAPPLA